MRFSQSAQLSLALAGAAMAKTVTVQVSDANNELKFFPNTVQADMGDLVQFVFNPINHSVAESASYEQACEPLTGGSGFNSGFQPVKMGATEQSTFTVTVSDTNPHWFYCAQGKHCEAGMVGVINPPSNETAEGFAANAAKYNKTTIPEGVYGGTPGTVPANSTGNSTSTGGMGGSGNSTGTGSSGNSTGMGGMGGMGGSGGAGPSPTNAPAGGSGSGSGTGSGTGSASSGVSSAGAANVAAGASFAAAVGAAVAALL